MWFKETTAFFWCLLLESLRAVISVENTTFPQTTLHLNQTDAIIQVPRGYTVISNKTAISKLNLLFNLPQNSTKANSTQLFKSAFKTVDIGDTDVSSTVLAYFCEGPKSCAPVFEHVKNPTWNQERKRYYVFPQFRVDLGSLTHKSVAIFNKHYAEFQVQMYDQCYLQKVSAYLTTVVKAKVESFQVAPYSLHQVRLSWAEDPAAGSGISMSQNPVPQTAQTPKLQLRIYTNTGKKAQELVDTLKQDSSLFDLFRLDYSLTAADTAQQLITVKTSSAMETEFYTKLNNMMGKSKSVYLTSEDLSDFAQQTLQKVIASQYQDSNYVVTPENRISILDLIKEALQIDQSVISSVDDKRWNSVFWNDEWSRPDYLTHFLNDKFTMDQGASRNFSYLHSDIRKYLETHHASSSSSSSSAEASLFDCSADPVPMIPDPQTQVLLHRTTQTNKQ